MKEEWILTELHNAAYNCDLDWVNERIEAGDDVNARDSKGFTPLHWCAFRSMVGGEPCEIAGLLIDNGADPNAKTVGSYDYSVLNWAVDAGNFAVVELLIKKGADVNLVAGDVTPLMRAAAGGDKQMVELLIRNGAEVKLKAGNFTALDYADYSGQDHLLELLAH